MQGELYLARSRRRRIKPMPIPADLQAAMTDANMFSRLGAVSVLQSRLLSDNLPSAVGAYEALLEIARTDIQYVADPAKAALQEVALHPGESELRFEPVPQGSAQPHRVIHLLGPPIARTCTPHASEGWIHIKETAEGFDVSIDTAQAGTANGTINLKGPTGELVVAVTITIIPKPSETSPVEAAKVTAAPLPAPPPETPAPVATSSKGAPAVTSSEEPTQATHGTRQVMPSQAGKASGPASVPSRPISAPRTTPPISSSTRGLGAGSVLWALIPVLSLGILTPIPFASAAIKLKGGALWAITTVYALVWLALLVALLTGSEWALASVLVLSVVATVHAFVLRRRVFAPSLSAPTVQQRLAPYDSVVLPIRRTAEGSADGAVPHFRVVALGVAGSGKTVYLSSMFHMVNVPTPGRSYFLETSAAHRIYLSKVFDELSDTAEPWPRGTRTGETRELDFDCVSFDEGVKHQVFKISYLDYAGELLESEQEAGSTALSDLEERIRNAHGLLGMLDGYRVLQFLRNEPAGRRYFRSSIQPMIGIMAGVSCPIHFVLTKWDLIRRFGEPADADDNLRLSLVKEALMETTQLKALVDTHSWSGRVIRLIPVSAVGPGFAQLDEDGRVLKRPDGEVNPTNIEVPLTAILPDLFRQVEQSLDAHTRQQVACGEARSRGSRFSMQHFLRLPAGATLRQRLQDVIGGPAGKEVAACSWTGSPAYRRRRAGRRKGGAQRQARWPMRSRLRGPG